LDVDEFKAYFLFLENPTPKARWCIQNGGRGQKRGSKEWRPFVGPLNANSRATAITVVNSLVTYLVDAQYLAYHPLKLIRKKQVLFQNPTVRKLKIKQRILEQDEWEMMQQVLEKWPDNTPHERDEKERLRFLVRILFFLGLRVNELVTHTWGAFQKEEGLWWFYVLGKGDKLAKIPVNDEFMDDVRRFRTHLRYTAEPEVNESGALIHSWNTQEAIKDRYVNMLLKKLALKTAEKFQDKPEKCEKLKRFSAHWLRHLFATQQDRAGISFTDIRDNCRHENEATTRLYVHAFDKSRHEAMSKLTLRSWSADENTSI
jgi:integrase